MNKFISVTAILVASSSLVAQNSHGTRVPSTKTTIKVATKNGLAVIATVDKTTNADSVADATDVSRGKSLRASTANSRAYCSTYPRYLSRYGSGAALRDSGHAGSSSGKYKGTACSANGSKTTAKCSAHSVLVHFDVPDGEEVVIAAYYSGVATGGATGSGAIDVGNDGSVELTAKNGAKYAMVNKDVKVKAGKNGIDVLLTTMGTAANVGKVSSRYESYARVYCTRKVKTTKCTITAFDEKVDPDKDPTVGCGGKLAASTGTSGSSRWIRLTLTGTGSNNSVGFFVVGDKQVEMALPGSACKLLVNPVAYSAFNTNSKGEASHYIRVSSALKGTMYVQDVIATFDAKGLKLTSSNGLKIECKQQ